MVIFDENKVTDKSTFEKPHQYSYGFKFVLVNGKLTLENGKHTGVRNGTVVRGLGYRG
jgi:N-acyl-D-amino-acid deacylase